MIILLVLTQFLYAECITTSGEPILDGESVHLFKYDVAPPGEACIGQEIRCVGGVIEGDPQYIYNRCTTEESCEGPQGLVKPGESAVFYKSLEPPCEQETRTCSAGILSGSFTEISCYQPKDIKN